MSEENQTTEATKTTPTTATPSPEQTAIENVAAAAGQVIDATSGMQTVPSTQNKNLDFILDVGLNVSVVVGSTKMSIQNLLQLSQGVVIELNKLAGEPLDVYINERLIARGEAVIVNEKFGVRITDIISQQERVSALG